MKKKQITYSCQPCGTQYAKWQGKCDACQAWNTIIEKTVTPTLWRTAAHTHLTPATPKLLHEIGYTTPQRILCSDQEFNRVLGGGIVPSSLVLLGGEPGIGKSTLLLQIALSLCTKKVLYVSGEESEVQIKMRAERLALSSTHCYILNETFLPYLLQQVAQLQPDVLMIDSIQTLYTDHIEAGAGSIAQVSACTALLMQYAKSTHVSIFLIGHNTKEGFLAGPKLLEHMVDTVLQFEGDRHLSYRIVRTLKNRFGATAELGMYTMHNQGLRVVTNPSALFLSQTTHSVSGVAIGAALEGSRPLLIEVQALVSPAMYSTAQRSTTGFTMQRLHMLLAVIEKRGGLRLGKQDVFLNIAGGLHIADPALDLAVCLAIISACKGIALPFQSCFAAEVGLSGEVRGIQRVEQRIIEAAKLGFQTIFIATYHQKELCLQNFSIHIACIAHIEEIIHWIDKNL